MEPFDGQRWQAEQQRQAEQQQREQEERLRLDEQRRLDERLQREREFEEQAILNREAPAAKSWWQRLFGASRQGSPGPRQPGARRRR